jgi:hypothetical protein
MVLSVLKAAMRDWSQNMARLEQLRMAETPLGGLSWNA